MRATIHVICIMLLVVLSAPVAAASSTEEELVAIALEIDQAIEPGDKSVFDRHLTEDFVLVDRDGLRTLTKKDILDGTSPLPDGYWLKFDIDSVQLRELGDVAVLIFRTIEREGIHDQEILVHYMSTMVFVRQQDAWKIGVWHYVEAQKDAPPVKVSGEKLDALVGTYVMGPGIRYVVARRGDALVGAREGRPEEMLVPESADVFYVPGTEFRRIFVKDDSGRVIEMLGRRKGTDLRWTRVYDDAAGGMQ